MRAFPFNLRSILQQLIISNYVTFSLAPNILVHLFICISVHFSQYSGPSVDLYLSPLFPIIWSICWFVSQSTFLNILVHLLICISVHFSQYSGPSVYLYLSPLFPIFWSIRWFVSQSTFPNILVHLFICIYLKSTFPNILVHLFICISVHFSQYSGPSVDLYLSPLFPIFWSICLFVSQSTFPNILVHLLICISVHFSQYSGPSIDLYLSPLFPIIWSICWFVSQSTFLHIVPPILLFLSKHPMAEHTDFSSIRSMFVGAAPCSSETIDVWMNKLKRNIDFRQGSLYTLQNCPRLTLNSRLHSIYCGVLVFTSTSLILITIAGYGLTEASPLTHCNPPERSKYHSVGPAINNTQYKVGPK